MPGTVFDTNIWIAVTARRAGALLVTDNLVDFEKIRPYCKVKLISGSDYFGG